MTALDIKQNVPLAPFTTFGIGGPAEHFVRVTSVSELREALAWARERSERATILGGGSNVLIADEGIRGLVIHMSIGGITYEEIYATHIHVRVGAGVQLDALVAELVTKNIWGLENLSAIPGTVGATPIQNVGAYGVEVKDVIESVEVLDRETNETRILTNAECAFGYRDSVFKRAGGDRYIVTSVAFSLSQEERPKLTYGELVARFPNDTASQSEIRDAIIEIRAGKLPDWHTLGTAGSFFKNPSVKPLEAARLKEKYPNMPLFPQPDGNIKLSLGWILEHVLHKKGFRKGNVGLFEKQALVLVNYGGATCDEVLVFSDDLIREVKEKLNIDIEREVRVLR